jgi:NDP-sugar pyrophosphorylase family protein
MHSRRVDVDLGVIESEDGLVSNYIEKPTLRYQVSMGIYVYDERALRHLPDGPCQFPELVLRLLAGGARVGGGETDADWYDIGTVGEYERAAADVERAPEKYRLEPVLFPPRDAFPALQTPNGDRPKSENRDRPESANGARPRALASERSGR